MSLTNHDLEFQVSFWLLNLTWNYETLLDDAVIQQFVNDAKIWHPFEFPVGIFGQISHVWPYNEIINCCISDLLYSIGPFTFEGYPSQLQGGQFRKT